MNSPLRLPQAVSARAPVSSAIGGETTAPVVSAAAKGKASPDAPAWPFYVAMAYLVVDFGRPQDWVPALGMLRPGILVSVLGFLAILIYRKEVAFPSRAKLVVVFLVLLALGTPLATNRFYAFRQTKDLSMLFFSSIVPLMTFTNTFQRLKRLTWLFILLHIPLSIYCITHKGFGVGAFLADENDFCLALNVALPYVFFAFFYSKSLFQRLVLLGTLGLLLFSTTSTMSRGGFLGVLAVGFFCWLATPRKIASLALMVVLTVPLVAMIPDSFWKEMETIKTADQEGDTGEQRLYFWGLGWRMFLDNPIFGVGPTNYQYNADKYESAERANRGEHVWGRPVHSIYFTLLPETGVTGTAVFFAILILNWRESRRIRARYLMCVKEGTLPKERLDQLYVISMLTRANGASLVAYLVTGAFLSVLYYPHFWLQIGFAIAMGRVFWSLVPADEVKVGRAGLRPAPLGRGAVLRPALTS